MSEMGTPEDLAEVSDELTEAIMAFNQIDSEKKRVDRAHTEASNRLSKAQKAFDVKVEEMRKTAAWGTEWHSQRNRGNLTGEERP